MPIWLIILVIILYTLGLFFIAWDGDRRAAAGETKFRAISYALAIAVYCTSWTYFGAVGTAASSQWDYVWIYAGPALVFLTFTGVIRRIGDIAQKESVTSLSDFLSARYGKSREVAVLATLAAVMGALPYIALQLKSVGMSFSALADQGAESQPANETVLLTALAMAVFAIFFGARQTDVTKHNPGLISVLSFEAIIKLMALIAVCLLSVHTLGGDFQVWSGRTVDHFGNYSISGRAITTLFLSTAAIICLPRQFHVAIIERQDKSDLNMAKWLFPIYLIVTTIVVIPITIAGLELLPYGSSPDLFVIALPLSSGDGVLAMFVFLGGFSAATGMVIVSTLALSTMITNDLIFPIFFNQSISKNSPTDQAKLLVLIRRIVIFSVLLLAYGYFRMARDSGALAQIGLLSFAAAAQFSPALIGAVYWRSGKHVGVLWGLGTGMIVWAYTMFLPAIFGVETVASFAPVALHPHGLFGLTFNDSLTHGVFWSMLLNIILFISLSVLSKERLRDTVQASAFTGSDPIRVAPHNNFVQDITSITPDGLQALAARFLNPDAVHHAFHTFQEQTGLTAHGSGASNWRLIQHTEKLLARAIGASSARVIMSSAIGRNVVELDRVLTIFDQTAQGSRFNKHMLQATLENIAQGISVVDSEQKLVAWNGVYADLFAYPDHLLKVGTPIQALIKFNMENGWSNSEASENPAQKRADFMQAGRPHLYDREHLDGRILRIAGSPMPGGGYVTTFTDITKDKLREKSLREANETLEYRVAERTKMLKQLTVDLEQAREEAEGANQSKTRFLAAASHDLLQPLNAARLFLGAIDSRENAEILRKVDQSIRSADDLLKGLLDISRLDHSKVIAQSIRVPLNTVFQDIVDEALPMVEAAGLTLRYVPTRMSVKTDPDFLISILRNLVSNARRYTQDGGIVLGARRDGSQNVRIEIWDSGVGISEDDQDRIFEEFTRIQDHDNLGVRGAGLGLSICQRMADLMGTKIELMSWQDIGSVFSLKLPRGQDRPNGNTIEKLNSTEVSSDNFENLNVLCIDDEPTILDAMTALLGLWKCNVFVSTTGEEAIDIICRHKIDVIIADYQLGTTENGLDVVSHLRPHLEYSENVCLLTAQRTESLELLAKNDNVKILNKPAAPVDIQSFLALCKSRFR